MAVDFDTLVKSGLLKVMADKDYLLPAAKDKISRVVKSEFDKEIGRLKTDKFADNVFHYTSIDSFTKIISSQSFHASNSSYLNDRQEFKLGLDVFHNILKGNPKSIIKHLKEKLSESIISDRYVMCFSEKEDLLSQWRAYGRNGLGLSVGFNKKTLIAQYDYANSFNVIYNSDKQRQIAQSLFHVCIKELGSNIINKNRHLKINFSEKAAVVFDIILEYIGYFKHYAFEEEGEFRIEMKAGPDLKIEFNPKDSLLIPFVKLEPSKIKTELLPLKKIIVGPSLDFNLTRRSLCSFLEKQEYDLKEIEILDSKIPYRI